jgi:hypothetical protein
MQQHDRACDTQGTTNESTHPKVDDPSEIRRLLVHCITNTNGTIVLKLDSYLPNVSMLAELPNFKPLGDFLCFQIWIL